MAAPVVATIGTAATGNTDTDLTVPVPAGTVDGDLLVLCATAGATADIGGGSPGIFTPAGWDSREQENIDRTATAVGLGSSVFTRIASSEPANYTVLGSLNNAAYGMTGRIIRITGHHATNWLNTSNSNQFSGAATTTHTASGVTTTVDECLLLWYIGVAAPALVTVTTSDSSEQYDFGFDAGTASMQALATETLSAAGASGTNGWTTSGSVNRVGMMCLAIAPAPSTGSGNNRRLLLGVG